MKTRISERHMLMGLVIVFSVLLVLRSVSNIFVYPLILVGAAAVALLPLSTCLPVLCFLLPFANIIKISPGQISLFTALFAIYVLRIIFKTGRLNRMFLLTAFLFAGYCLAVSGPGKIVVIVTMVCGFAMLREVTESDAYNYQHVLYAFCFGIIISSCLGMLREQLPIIESFSQDELHKIGHEEYAARFVGLNINPNYYTMDISVAMGCLVTTICTHKMKPIYMILFVVLAVFGLMSVSKSFLLVLAVMVVILLLNSIGRGGTAFFKLSFVLILAGILILTFAKEAVETYVIRLNADSGGDLSSVTTGRGDIWLEYIKTILKDLKILFFGAGLGNQLEKAPHNTYIEMIYYIGATGVALYLFLFKSSIAIKEFPRNILYYIPILIILIRLMGIGMFIQDSFWYYMALICLLLMEDKKREQIRNNNNL
ncbi:MAG: hypothetical protein IKK37_06415 [Clostridia bacterium]|nr:hypothetical protein [Clostridia bacterium]